MRNEPAFHGTMASAKRHHPVFDINFFIQQCVFEEKELRSNSGWIDSPRRLVRADTIIRRVAAEVDLGKPEPVDFFTWAYNRFPDPRNLTRIGGRPWRDAGRAWPKSAAGVPLVFIGQFNFLDSLDLFDGRLPGQVLLLFAESLDMYTGEIYAEWSPSKLKKPADYADVPPNAMHALTLSGVIHRTNHYPHAEESLDKAGLSPFYVGTVGQATQIGRVGAAIQGEPFKDRKDVRLIAMLSSICLEHANPEWPLVNIATLPTYITPNGQSLRFSPFDLGIGDAGAVYIGLDKKSNLVFKCVSG